MNYQNLISLAWRSGSYQLAKMGRRLVSKKTSRRDVEKQMREIVERDAADAIACLSNHKEGIMKLAPFVKFREEKFGAVLFETRSEKVFTLNPTGAAVVREIVAGTQATALPATLKSKYEDPKGALAQEAEVFLQQLKDKGLVTE